MDPSSLYQKFLLSTGVSTDTRHIKPGSMFFALKGPHFDANAFANEAISKGARFAIVDDERYRRDDDYVLVHDTLQALQQLAAYHRRQFKIPVIGLTGSNGKTTTKELLQAVLSTKYKTSATRGNLNNHIGVPLTLLEIDASVEVAVVEMGANHIGEIADLCAIAGPTHGLITNIGKAHIGTFGGAENILRAKTELFQYLLEHDGSVFINSQNPLLANLAKRFRSPVFYPAKGDYCYCELVSADPFVQIEMENGQIVDTQLTGSYNFENIAAALCAGKFFGVGGERAAAALQNYQPGNMRSQIIRKRNNVIILDAYNANPSSMEAALTNLAMMKSNHRVAILGDMYELGDETEEEHRKLGRMLRDNKIDEVYLCGELIKIAQDEFPKARYFQAQDQMMQFLREHPLENSTILVKASRGMRLERTVDVL